MRNKKILIVGAVHGNEKVGAEIIEKKIRSLKKNNIKGIIANREALKNGVRFIKEDLNRIFPGKVNGNHEEKIAYRLTKKIKIFDYLLDIHSFSCKSEPFAILTRKTKNHLKLAKASGVKKIVFMSPKMASGKSLIDYSPCGISIEVGKNDLKSTYKNAEKFTMNILLAFGFLKGKKKRNIKIDYFEVIDIFYKKNNKILSKNIKNFNLIIKGEVVAKGKNGEFIAPYNFYPVLAGEKAYNKVLCLVAKRAKIKEEII